MTAFASISDRCVSKSNRQPASNNSSSKAGISATERIVPFSSRALHAIKSPSNLVSTERREIERVCGKAPKYVTKDFQWEARLGS
jgi:hypothetical protein